MSLSSDIVPQQDFLGMYKPNHPCGGLEQHIVADDPTPELLANHDDHHTDTMAEGGLNLEEVHDRSITNSLFPHPLEGRLLGGAPKRALIEGDDHPACPYEDDTMEPPFQCWYPGCGTMCKGWDSAYHHIRAVHGCPVAAVHQDTAFLKAANREMQKKQKKYYAKCRERDQTLLASSAPPAQSAPSMADGTAPAPSASLAPLAPLASNMGAGRSGASSPSEVTFWSPMEMWVLCDRATGTLVTPIKVGGFASDAMPPDDSTALNVDVFWGHQ